MRELLLLVSGSVSSSSAVGGRKKGAEAYYWEQISHYSCAYILRIQVCLGVVSGASAHALLYKIKVLENITDIKKAFVVTLIKVVEKITLNTSKCQ